MAGFEYKVHCRTIRTDARDLEELLNEYAKDNWRLKIFDERMGFYILERGISGRRPKEG